MFTVNSSFVDNRLKRITEYVKRLSIVLTFSDNEILLDFFKFHTLERLLQLIVDEMVDINNHFIRSSASMTPDTFQGTFHTMFELKVLPLEFADRLAPVVGLRNRLVHRYEEIQAALVIEAVRREHNDFGEYTKYVRDALSRA